MMMKTILVVDDETRIRRIYDMLLTAEGYRVIQASSGVEANDILKNETIDLVLLDLRMPEVNGNTLYEVLRLFHQRIKVIVSSVYNAEKQKKIIPHASDCHDKSHGIDVLLSKIRTTLMEGEPAEIFED